MSDTLLFALPQAPDADCRETHWWRVVDGQVVEDGVGDDWLALADERRPLVAIAPAGPVRLSCSPSASPATTPRQAAAVARVAAVESSLGDRHSLHAVSEVADDGTVTTAVVDHGVMLAWLDWAKGLGADPDHVVPAGAILPLSDCWTAAEIGTEHVVGRRGTVLPNEPELVEQVVGSADVRTLGEAEVRAALASAAEAAPLDLRTGRFARRAGLAIERHRVRELVILAALIPLLMLAAALVAIFKLERSTSRLNAESLSVASSALGRPVTLETAESELAKRNGGSAYGGLMSPLTATYQALQPEQSVSSTSLAYSPDGMLSLTLAAPTVDPLNRVLLALQSNGYKVTAVSRQSLDGRQMIDMTVRTKP